MNLPNGPRYSRLLRLYKFIFNPLDYLDENKARYGDIIAIERKKQPPFVYVSDPETIEHIFTNPNLFECVGISAKGRSLTSYLLGSNSLLLLNGDRHRKARKLLIPPFHGDRLSEYSQLIDRVTDRVTNNWTFDKPIPVRPIMADITLEVILEGIFGLKEGDRYQELRELIPSLLNTVSSPAAAALIFFSILRKDWIPFSPWKRFVKLKERLEAIIYEEISDRRLELDTSDRTDILSLLISAKDENGEGMSDEELHDHLITFLLVGHETTVSGICWAFYWVNHLPEVRAKLRSELSTVDSKDLDLVAKLPYLHAVCQESLRIYPVAIGATVRTLKYPTNIMGYDLPAGTAIMPSIYLVHQREDLYPQPKRFIPERFLQRQYSAYEYFPFGGGNHRCVGAALAMLTMKLVIANLVSNFELELSNKSPVKPVRRGLTIVPSANLEIVVTGLRKQKSPVLV